MKGFQVYVSGIQWYFYSRMGSEGSLVGCPNETILLKTVLTTKQVFNRVDDLCIRELMFRKRMEFQWVHMSRLATGRKSDREHDFGDHRSTHKQLS